MSLLTTRSWLLMTALLLVGVTRAQAQPGQSPVAPEIFAPGHWTPFAPVDTDPDYRWFAEPDLSEHGCDRPDANEGFFFQYDRLIWAFSRPKITEFGASDAERTVFLPTGFGIPIDTPPNGGIINYFNSLDTEFIESEWVWGNRFEFGYVVDDRGWLASALHVHTHDRRLDRSPLAAGRIDGVLDVNAAFFDPLGLTVGYLDLNNDGIDDDLNANGVFGRNGVPDDFEDQALSPIRFDSVLAQNRTSLHGVELMKVWRLPRMHYGGVWEWYLGARYLGMSDEFEIDADGGILADFDLFSRVNNFIVGPQVGARWARTRGRWTASAEGRFLAAANFQQVRLNGSYATLAAPGGPRGAFQNLTSSRFDDAQTDEVFAPVGELRVETQLRLTRAISLRMGYNGLVAGGTSRGSRRINYTLPEISILDANKNDAFIVNGFNFGFELNR